MRRSSASSARRGRRRSATRASRREPRVHRDRGGRCMASDPAGDGRGGYGGREPNRQPDRQFETGYRHWLTYVLKQAGDGRGDDGRAEAAHGSGPADRLCIVSSPKMAGDLLRADQRGPGRSAPCPYARRMWLPDGTWPNLRARARALSRPSRIAMMGGRMRITHKRAQERVDHRVQHAGGRNTGMGGLRPDDADGVSRRRRGFLYGSGRYPITVAKIRPGGRRPTRSSLSASCWAARPRRGEHVFSMQT